MRRRLTTTASGTSRGTTGSPGSCSPQRMPCQGAAPAACSQSRRRAKVQAREIGPLNGRRNVASPLANVSATMLGRAGTGVAHGPVAPLVGCASAAHGKHTLYAAACSGHRCFAEQRPDQAVRSDEDGRCRQSDRSSGSTRSDSQHGTRGAARQGSGGSAAGAAGSPAGAAGPVVFQTASAWCAGARTELRVAQSPLGRVPITARKRLPKGLLRCMLLHRSADLMCFTSS